MIRLTKISTAHPFYTNVEELMHESFPTNERRDDGKQRDATDHTPEFNCYYISTDDEPDDFLGFITIWHFEDFMYVEHLAISPKHRNRGFGKMILDKIKEVAESKLIILEVERPDDEMSRRRIGFYCRCGFHLCEKDYMQPPYREGEDMFPLYIMYCGTDSIDMQYEYIKTTIYKNVYHFSE